MPTRSKTAAVIRGVTFDFYLTLIHGQARGRGQRYHDYLAATGLTADPWEHMVLYDVFKYYGATYRIEFTEEEKSWFWTEFTKKLFRRTHAGGATVHDPELHRDAIREIFGTSHFSLYGDVLPVLDALAKKGARMAVISNWQCGLTPFCAELGMGGYFDAIVSSAEVGCDKPDPKIFRKAFRRMRLRPEEILHVGDNPIDDVAGAVIAGCTPVLLDREGVHARDDVIVIRSLSEVPDVMTSLRRARPGCKARLRRR